MRRTLVNRAHRLLQLALYRCGLLMGMVDRRLKGGAIVLTYHRVLPRDRQVNSFSSPAIIVEPETFQRHMRFLRENFTVLDIENFVRCIRRETPWPPRACLVTFDDGWHDNLEFAAPVLTSQGVQAVLFVAGDYIEGKGTFWQEELARRLFEAWQRRELPAEIAEQLCDGGNAYELDVGTARRQIWRLVSVVKGERESLLPRLLSSMGPKGNDSGPGEDRFLDWDQLRRLNESGAFAIGSHAMSHIPLTELPPEDVSTELVRSRQLLSEKTGKAPLALAYPNGNCSETVAGLARAAGFAVAFTTRPGLTRASDDPLQLKRLNVSQAVAPDEISLLGRIARLN